MKWLLRIVLTLAAILVIAFLVFRTPDTDPKEMRAKYGSEPSQFVEIGDGVTIHLRDEGPRDGVPIILLHGSNADLHTWELWVDRLDEKYRVIRFDQVGHGLTGPDTNDDYSLQNFVEDIDQVADALGLEKFVLGGNSMGGGHTIAYALEHPERLLGMVLVDAGGAPVRREGGGNIGFTIARTPLLNIIAEQVTPRSMIDRSLRQSVTNQDIVTEASVDRYWEMLRYPGNRKATMARFSHERRGPFTPTEIQSLDIPTLIIWGEDDTLIPVEAAQWYDEQLPNSALAVYPNIGHLPHEEAPQTLADLSKWLLNQEFTKQDTQNTE